MSKILEVKNLNVILDKSKIIDNLNIDVNKGEILAIIGPNGSGKTVFLKCLLGIMPYTGTIKWLEKVELGYVPQKLEIPKYLPLTFKELLAAKVKILNLPKQNIKEVIEEIGIQQEVLNMSLNYLSQGQFQRCLIALALINKPNVLLMDEPTANIDVAGEEQVYEIIHRLHHQYNLTVILVSHEINIVCKYATNILCLNKNKICYGPPHEAITPEVLNKLYGVHKHHTHTYNGRDVN